MASPGRCTCPAVRQGKTAERLASELERWRQHILVTSGEVRVIASGTTKAGEQSRLEVLVWQADVLASEVSAEGEARGRRDRAT